MSSALPPDLRVLCRKLTSTPSTQFPHSLPSLINHVIRCKKPLSEPQDQKAKGDAAERARLVHKLKTSITTLVNSRAREARFASIALIKTAVDVGGWEVLQDSKPWINGLLSILQKGDPIVMKELAIVALTRIYVLLHPYQTLVRELATPTIPSFAKACVQLISPGSSGEIPSTPSNVVETICDAFSTLIPLYPATFRPFSKETAPAIRFYLAPTESDDYSIPTSLQQSARNLSAAQHFVAAKSGGSEEWAKLIDGILNDLHATADQVLRAVDESWEPAGGNPRTRVELDHDPSGGGSHPDQLPAWVGIQSGAQRIQGLFAYLATCLSHSTKGPVALPLTKITDAITRVCLVARLSPKTQTWDQALQVKAAVGREEKDELWSVLPDIHMAAMEMLRTMLQKLSDNMVPYTSEALDHLLRVFGSGIEIPAVRSTSYATLIEILSAAGPSLSKSAVDMLQPPIGACCRDLQEDSGYLKQPKKVSSSAIDTKKNGLAANADLFLQQPQSSTHAEPVPLEPKHKAMAAGLLPLFLSRVPQQHLKPSLRSLLDQTAILTRNRDAMVASVLNPYTDPRGRRYPTILPHLTQQFPEDQSLEILRTNLRPDGAQVRSEEPISDIEEESDEDAEMGEAENVDEGGDEKPDTAAKAEVLPTAPKLDLPVQPNPFESSTSKPQTAAARSGFGDVRERAASPPKRKNEEPSKLSSKRQELEKPVEQVQPGTSDIPMAEVKPTEGDDDDDDSDESVHLNMELEDDDDDDEDDGA